MATGWLDISTKAFNGNYDGYIRFANQVLTITGAVTANTTNAVRVFNITPGGQYRVTMQMRNRFRLGCVPNLASGQTITNYVCDPLDTNDATDQGGTVRSLEISSEAGQVYLVVGAWSSGASAAMLETLNTIVLEQKQTYYTVTFQDWDKTVLKTEEVIEHKAAMAPDNPTRQGYTFTGWDVPFGDITADTVITAQYEALTFTVTFKDWDETVLKTEQVAYSQTATAPENPSREGYRFTGWDTPFNHIVADTVVTATYSGIVFFTVTFVDWDKTVLKTETVEQGHDATPPTDPVREGYTFTGWSPNYTNIQSDLVTTAQYEFIIIYHTVTFLDYDGSVLKTEQVEEGDVALPPLPPLRDGYVFDHWDADFSEVMTDLTVMAVYRTALDHTVIKIYDSAYALVQTVEKVLSASYQEALDGELTFEFSTLAARDPGIEVGYIAEYEGCYFNIVRVSKSISSGNMVVSVTCEHISYVLNEERYKISLISQGCPQKGWHSFLLGRSFRWARWTSPML